MQDDPKIKRIAQLVFDLDNRISLSEFFRATDTHLRLASVDSTDSEAFKDKLIELLEGAIK